VPNLLTSFTAGRGARGTWALASSIRAGSGSSYVGLGVAVAYTLGGTVETYAYSERARAGSTTYDVRGLPFIRPGDVVDVTLGVVPGWPPAQFLNATTRELKAVSLPISSATWAMWLVEPCPSAIAGSSYFAPYGKLVFDEACFDIAYGRDRFSTSPFTPAVQPDSLSRDLVVGGVVMSNATLAGDLSGASTIVCAGLGAQDLGSESPVGLEYGDEFTYDTNLIGFGATPGDVWVPGGAPPGSFYRPSPFPPPRR